SDLALLRSSIALEPHPWAKELAGATTSRGMARAVAYVAELIPAEESQLAPAQEAVAAAVREARGWLSGWTVSFAQAGTLVWMTGSASVNSDFTGVLHFAREVARATVAQGIRIHAALATGSGALFLDVEGRLSVASDVASRAAASVAVLRTQLPSNGASPPASLRVDPSSADLPATALEAAGWRALPGKDGAGLYLLQR